MKSRLSALAGVAVLVILTALSCKSSPSQKNIGLGPVDTGPGSVEYVRRQLTGTWTLQKFEVADAAGQFREIKANATLTYDPYGNVKVSGALLEPLPGQQQQELQPMLSYSGRIVIDTQKHEFRLQGQEGQADPSLQPSIGAQMVRRYEITPEILTVTYVDAQGKTTARTIFKRAS